MLPAWITGVIAVAFAGFGYGAASVVTALRAITGGIALLKLVAHPVLRRTSPCWSRR
ncbi:MULTISPECIES: hypothetical protein [unclassified Streptomyces]|uniref:hypothetical protein n=1 Tax=unclassified Streptomyces TaxID=2593676 RepID=UPI00274244E4|nr:MULTISPECIES: hypothetical protein [unclassified Streptomyces]